MRGFADPFTGYSILIRTLIYGVVPLFTIWQFFRLRRALHVFQLEGYKRKRFLSWCAANSKRALFLQKPETAKKPLVMTGRAWRILILATLLSAGAILGAWLAVHLAWGWPADVITWTIKVAAVFVFAPVLLVIADWLLVPVQDLINARYERAARRKLDAIAPVVIGVTGSFGKTSTKVATASVLGGPDRAFATPGSYNTPMGVVRAVNEGLQESHRYFVVEMGAYGEGEIAELCSFARPTVGVLTAIGPAHLDRFGSMDAIRRGKYEIVTSLPDRGTAVMNTDDLEVRALADRTSNVKVIRYGLDPEGRPHVTARGLASSSEGTSFTLVDATAGREAAVSTRLLGRHSVGHVLAATAVASALGIGLDNLVDRIARLEPAEHRLQLIRGTGGVTVIDDAYNSNPDGAAAALEVLASMPGGKKIVVTPGIVELGPLQREANEDFGRQAAAVADTLIVVARLNREAIVTGAHRANGPAEVVTVDSLDEATKLLGTLLSSGDVVLFENDLPDQYES